VQIETVIKDDSSLADKSLSTLREKFMLDTLKTRFEANMSRHPGMNWASIERKLKKYPQKLWTLSEMERTGGEPDVVGYNKESGLYLFFDCSYESPIGRRNTVYDKAAEDSLENYEHKGRIIGNAIDMAAAMGLVIPDRYQNDDIMDHIITTGDEIHVGSESWIRTPDEIRATEYALSSRRERAVSRMDLVGANIHNEKRGFRGMLWL
jgi:hypothetical protein